MKQTDKSRRRVLVPKESRKPRVIAEREKVVPISNLPAGTGMVPKVERDFVIQRLRREISHLKSEIKSLMDAIRFKNIKLMKQRHLWKLGLDYNE